MNGKKLVLATLSASLLLASVAEGFARPRHADRDDMPPRMPKEVIFVHMLKQFDTDKDGKIAQDELKAVVNKLFDTIDTNKDGSITPGEFHAFAKEKMKERREAMEKARAENKPEGDMPRHHKDMGPKDMDERDMGPGIHGMRHRPMGAMLFRHADTDENGQISRQEAQAAAEKLFARMDANKDGVISIDDMPDW